MSWSLATPRKQRTREHIIAAQSVNHVEKFIIDEGHVAQRVETDYGYDLNLYTFDADGYVEPGLIQIQLKAEGNLAEKTDGFAFDLDIRDYNLWMAEPLPVILVLYDATRRRAYWLHVQGYFTTPAVRRPKLGAKTIRVLVPKRRFTRRAVAQLRSLKGRTLSLLHAGGLT